jgi:hypothetical protein
MRRRSRSTSRIVRVSSSPTSTSFPGPPTSLEPVGRRFGGPCRGGRLPRWSPLPPGGQPRNTWGRRGGGGRRLAGLERRVNCCARAASWPWSVWPASRDRGSGPRSFGVDRPAPLASAKPPERSASMAWLPPRPTRVCRPSRRRRRPAVVSPRTAAYSTPDVDGRSEALRPGSRAPSVPGRGGARHRVPNSVARNANFARGFDRSSIAGVQSRTWALPVLPLRGTRSRRRPTDTTHHPPATGPSPPDRPYGRWPPCPRPSAATP